MMKKKDGRGMSLKRTKAKLQTERKDYVVGFPDKEY